MFTLERDSIEYRTIKGWNNTRIFSPVVTTNYDLVLETYSSKTSNKYGKDFFRRFIEQYNGNMDKPEDYWLGDPNLETRVIIGSYSYEPLQPDLRQYEEEQKQKQSTYYVNLLI